jgi:hypothetical protein
VLLPAPCEGCGNRGTFENKRRLPG